MSTGFKKKLRQEAIHLFREWLLPEFSFAWTDSFWIYPLFGIKNQIAAILNEAAAVTSVFSTQ